MSLPIRGPGGPLVFPIGSKNTNLVKDVDFFLKAKLRWMPFRRRWVLASCQVSANFVQRFQRSRKCEKLTTDARRTTYAQTLFPRIGPDYIVTWLCCFTRWELVRTLQHNLRTERTYFTVVGNHIQQRENVQNLMLSRKQSYSQMRSEFSETEQSFWHAQIVMYM